MRRTRVALFVHLVWATWDRAPVLVGEVERRVHRAIEASCVEMGAEALAVGGVEDHIHLLARLPATLTVADLAQRVKGASAHLVTHVVAPDTFFKWQGGYAAFSISQGHLDVVRAYIAHQKEHHHNGSLIPEWEDATDAAAAIPPSPQ
ncbi:MAG: IS200/IS605 family transposase [Chloroflexota bacterium]|nr:IS200/IS605 family transposase [Chloroflexota bacterium]